MIQRFKVRWVFSFMGLVFATSLVQAQATIGAKGAALGKATTALYEDEWGLFSNPATISSKKTSLGFYGLQNYGFPELIDISSVISIPLPFGYSSVGFYRFGDDLYSETNINAGYKYVWKTVHVGAALQYRHLSLGGDYGSGGALNVTLGLLTKINEKLWLGAKVRNINRAAYNFEFNDETLPQDLSIGFMYQLEEKASFVFDVLKDVRFPVSYRGGVEVEIVENVVGRIGATYEPVIYTFGLGYDTIRWQINIAVQQHEILGTSPGADILLKL